MAATAPVTFSVVPTVTSTSPVVLVTGPRSSDPKSVIVTSPWAEPLKAVAFRPLRLTLPDADVADTVVASMTPEPAMPVVPESSTVAADVVPDMLSEPPERLAVLVATTLVTLIAPVACRVALVPPHTFTASIAPVASSRTLPAVATTFVAVMGPPAVTLAFPVEVVTDVSVMSLVSVIATPVLALAVRDETCVLAVIDPAGAARLSVVAVISPDPVMDPVADCRLSVPAPVKVVAASTARLPLDTLSVVLVPALPPTDVRSAEIFVGEESVSAELSVRL